VNQWALRAACFLLIAVTVGACTDMQGRFGDFQSRVLDAGAIDWPDAEPLDLIPDVTGEFLLTLSPGAAPANLIQYLAVADMTYNSDGTATASLSLTALSLEGRLPVGETMVATDVLINEAGRYEATVSGTLPASANAIGGFDMTSTTTFLGTVMATDFTCGIVTGEVTAPVASDIAGSTYGAYRIEVGTRGSDLPEELISKCPQ